MWRGRTGLWGWGLYCVAVAWIVIIAGCVSEALDTREGRQTLAEGRFAPRKLLQTDADWDMWAAALLNDTDDFFAALEDGADVNVSLGFEGACPCTALILSSDAGNLQIVQALISADADLDAATAKGAATAIFAASQKGRSAIVDVLIAAGADVEKARSTGATPLMVAAENAHAGVVGALLRGGADAGAADGVGQTALHLASMKIGEASREIAEALIDAGANIEARDADMWTPLIWAAHFGNVGTFSVLLERGADPAVKDASGGGLEDHICQCPLVPETATGLVCPEGGCDSGAADAIAEMLRS
ncbi:unnamed protein product [Ostreobium quekettii]|uniref:Ankyrin repeat domain-containing protein n=1 Tax=Ostreobium quekettii TaxID=121088 RepID=A0A8S1J8G6_9CHLO|nr:unnamed protein product [Ostreobium quekettii]